MDLEDIACDNVILVSSAYIRAVANFKQAGKSLI